MIDKQMNGGQRKNRNGGNKWTDRGTSGHKNYGIN